MNRRDNSVVYISIYIYIYIYISKTVKLEDIPTLFYIHVF
jgi:hypothetical protein